MNETTDTASTPLLVQAVEDLLAGAAITAPLTGRLVARRDLFAAPQDVTAACALGAFQVGHSLRLGLPDWSSDAPGRSAEFSALSDAYLRRYLSGIVTDNDRWGRDAVVARCKELVNTLPPADLADAAGAQ